MNLDNKYKLAKKNFVLRSDFTPFMSKSFQIWDHFFALLLLKDSEYLKSLDIEQMKKKIRQNLDFDDFFHFFTPFKRLPKVQCQTF